MIKISNKEEWFEFAAGALLATIFFLVWISLNNSGWKQRCVEHGAAHYDSQTGKWMWNDAKP